MFFKRSKKIIKVLLCIIICLTLSPSFLHGDEDVTTIRPDEDGFLIVNGTDLMTEDGRNAVLRGISAHGLSWYPDYINDSLFNQLSTEWNCNLIRLPLYSRKYVEENDTLAYRTLIKGIEFAISNDMYVLVDWHVLDEQDPNVFLEEAKAFFDEISRKYANVPNLIYEICNEPNGKTDWNDIYAYADQIIPIIRSNSPKAVIVVGTAEYGQDLDSPMAHPLPYENIMYSLHFYAASHYDKLQSELKKAHEAKLPVFISECGITEADGDGRIDFENAVTWFELLNEYQISYVVWSLSNKAETSAMIKPRCLAYEQLKTDDLTYAGTWVRQLIQGRKPSAIPYPHDIDWDAYRHEYSIFSRLGGRGLSTLRKLPLISLISFIMTVCLMTGGIYMLSSRKRKHVTYEDIIGGINKIDSKIEVIKLTAIFISVFFNINYFIFRFYYSIPFYNVFGVIANIILLFFEITGFAETLIHYAGMLRKTDHALPKIADEEFPDVDIFIATYNEDEELLRRTVNGCKHLQYPDKDKVHIWLCDDNRRANIRKLAEKMEVGYFDRPDNEGAKAGNLNAALARTSAPYVVTLDADMIVRSCFLLKTIPYFINFEKTNIDKPEDKQVHLGLLQTPQCFYDPDVFQHALYSETIAPNEQDFFYRSIEVAKTSSNSVIYGGSNTVISRKALESIGGFYTKSITEDFATGMLIEAAGYVSLAIPEPLASGRTPHTFKEHIQQRTRWGRGVIATARQLKLFSQKGLSILQKVSYWSSVFYWYSPIKNFIYITAPLLFAILSLPVFDCNWLELLIFWVPMFLMQDICLRLISGNEISSKWSGIYETSVMPHLLMPIIKESLGINMSRFRVTDKTAKSLPRRTDYRSMRPFLILLALSFIGIIRVIILIYTTQSMGLLTILFWLFRNSYFLIMAVFLVDGRNADSDVVKVKDGEPLTLRKRKGRRYEAPFEGITTMMTEHSMEVYLDESPDRELNIGDYVMVTIDNLTYKAELKGVITNIISSRFRDLKVYHVEILDYGKDEYEYFAILYDRIPTLPQSLNRDIGYSFHMWRNIILHMADTVR